LVKHILITGASGLIGTRLTEILLERGYSVAHLGRSKKEDKVKSFVWNVDSFVVEPGALRGITSVIHLAGAGVADKRWTKERKKEILESRVKSSALLFETLNKGHHHITSVISASAIGYYGIHDEQKVFVETDPPGSDFMSHVTQKWEEEVVRIRSTDIRVVKLRVGIVLSDRGGALKKMVEPIKLFVGAPLGSGNQSVNWIHIDDLCEMLIKAVEDEQMSGVYNATGPYPVTNSELTKTIGKILHRPILLPFIPSFVLRTVLGEMADYVLKGSKVSSEKIQKAGFQFKFKNLEEALEDLLGRSVNSRQSTDNSQVRK
jgi:uncharacterized protein (TIGR01777 family)